MPGDLRSPSHSALPVLTAAPAGAPATRSQFHAPRNSAIPRCVSDEQPAGPTASWRLRPHRVSSQPALRNTSSRGFSGSPLKMVRSSTHGTLHSESATYANSAPRAPSGLSTELKMTVEAGNHVGLKRANARMLSRNIPRVVEPAERAPDPRSQGPEFIDSLTTPTHSVPGSPSTVTPLAITPADIKKAISRVEDHDVPPSSRKLQQLLEPTGSNSSTLAVGINGPHTDNGHTNNEPSGKKFLSPQRSRNRSRSSSLQQRKSPHKAAVKHDLSWSAIPTKPCVPPKSAAVAKGPASTPVVSANPVKQKSRQLFTAHRTSGRKHHSQPRIPVHGRGLPHDLDASRTPVPPLTPLSRFGLSKSRPSSPHSPSSASSSRQSSRSVTDVTKRLFSALRHSSSRASLVSLSPSYSNAPSGQTSPDPEWEVLKVEREPTDLAQEELDALVAAFGDSNIMSPSQKESPIDSGWASENLDLGVEGKEEVLKYPAVYYHGGSEMGGTSSTDGNGDFDYKLGDHIAYRYEIVSELGKGSFGKVLKCQDHKTGRLVAVKVIANRKGLYQQARLEATMLKDLNQSESPDKTHVVRYLGHFSFRSHLCICTEMLGTSLYVILKENKYQGLNVDLVRYISRQVTEGLAFLETKGVIHCDVKPENILVSNLKYCQVKLIDFGSGCYEHKKVFTYIQSRFYRAPEVILGMPYDFGIDMWSLGCLVAELIVGRPIFPGEDEADQIACISQVIGKPDPHVLQSCARATLYFDARGLPLCRRSPKGVIRGLPKSRPLKDSLPPLAADFTSQLLQWAPQKRLKPRQALCHDFLYEI